MCIPILFGSTPIFWGNIHISPWEKEHHFLMCLGRGHLDIPNPGAEIGASSLAPKEFLSQLFNFAEGFLGHL